MAFNHLKFKKAELKDVFSLIELQKKASSHPISPSLLESEFSNGGAHIFLALYGQKIVGYIDYWEVLGEIDIINIAIDPEFQRKGIGTKLFEQIKNQAGEIQKIFLEVRYSNEGARLFYHSMGFKEISVRKNYYRDGEDAITMELLLTSDA